MSVVVIGVGNPMRGDDAVGLKVVEALKKMPLPKEVTLHTNGGDAADLIGLLDGARAAVICDAVQTDEPAGSVVTVDCSEPLPQQLFLCSSHAFGVAEGIELARTLGQLPPACIIVGIAANKWAVGGGLSQPMKDAVPQAAQRVAAALQHISGVDHA
ncbi:MAG: hydrogenase maturation protease [Acidobacteriota bacterium]|nr:hydrogenase maturation protease [Acidobacteriota bacterium]